MNNKKLIIKKLILMIKNKIYSGSWIQYQEDLKKYITEAVIHKNWNHFIECHQLGAMPDKAIKWL